MAAQEITKTINKALTDPKLAQRLQRRAKAAVGKDVASPEMTALLKELNVTPAALATLQPKGSAGSYGAKTTLTVTTLTSLPCTTTTTTTTTTWVYDPVAVSVEEHQALRARRSRSST